MRRTIVNELGRQVSVSARRTGPRHAGPGPILAGVVAVSATAVAVALLAGIIAVGWWLS